jgi:hypothetical protein
LGASADPNLSGCRRNTSADELAAEGHNGHQKILFDPQLRVESCQKIGQDEIPFRLFLSTQQLLI